MSGLEFQLVATVMSWGVNSYVAAQVIVYGTALAVTAYAGSRIAEQKQKEIEKKMRRAAANRAIEIQNMQAGTVAPRRFIYGETIVNGHLIFQETHSDNKNFLCRVLYLGEGPINDATELYFNDVDQTSYLSSVAALTGNNAAAIVSGPYSLYASAVVGLNGGAGATRSAFNIVGKTSWTSDCKMTGNAWLGYQLQHNNEIWTQGIPQVRVKVEGRKLYDPRKDSTSSAYDSSLGTTTHRVDDETTWEYSNNSALCILDFLVNAMKVDIEDIDVASIATATEICDEDVTINDANGQSTTQKRYTTNGVAFLDEEVIATVEQLLAPCHGSLVEEGGILRLIVPKDSSTVTANITEDDIISELTINVNSEVSNRINKVGGTFIDSANQFQQMDFSPVSSSSLITSDGREHLQQIDLSFVTDEARAQRIASIVLKENALTNSLNLTLKPKFSYLKVGDIVTVTFEPEKLADVGTDSILTTATKWRVASYTLTPEGAVSLALDEYADSSYAWSTADHDYLTRSAVADNFYETGSRPTIGTVSSANHLDENGNQVLGIDVPITHSDHPNLMQSTVFLYRYGYNSTNGTETTLGTFGSVRLSPDDTVAKFMGMTTQIEPKHANTSFTSYKYKVSVKSYYINGLSSSVSSTDVTSLIGIDTTAPSAPSTSSGSDAAGAFRSVKLTWTNPTDVDFAKVKIYKNTVNNFSTADLIGEAVGTTFTDTGLSDSATFHYWVTALDRVGNESSGFYLGSATTDAAFPKGEKGETGTSVKGDKGQEGDSVKGDKGDSVKGDKGEEGTSVKGEKGEAVKGEKGQEGEPSYPPFGKFAYYYSTSGTANQDGRIYFGNSNSDPDNSPSDGTWPSTIYIRLDEDGKRLAGDGFSAIYLQTELDNAVRPAGSGMVIWENDDNWAYYRSSTNGGGYANGYHYMEGTRVSYKGSIDVVGQWYKVMVEAEPLSALLVTLNGADLYMDGVDPRNNTTATQTALDSAFLNANPLLTRMSQIPENALVWARFIYQKSESFTTTTDQTTFTLTGGHTIDSQTVVNYDGDTLKSGDFASAQADASTGNSASIEITNQYLTRKGITSVPSGKTVVISYIQASARTWTYSTQDWSNHAATFDSPQIFSPSVLSKEVLTQSLKANEITADQLVLNKDVQLLDGAAWRVGKTTYSDTTDGIFFGNPAGTGTGNHAFAFTVTSNSGTSSEHGLEITPDQTKLIQPTVLKTSQGAVTSAQYPSATSSVHITDISTSPWNAAVAIKSSTLNPNAQSITINAIGGGGGGAANYAANGSATSGGTTTYALAVTTSGGTTTYTVNASGGAAGSGTGADKWRGDGGASSSYASGGAGGGSENAVGGGGSLGSGGGGGAGRPPDWNQSSKKGGAGGGAATVAQNTYDISQATSVTLTISSIGLGGNGGSSTNGGTGGAGGDGSVNYTIQTEGLEPVELLTQSEYRAGVLGRDQVYHTTAVGGSNLVLNQVYYNNTTQPIFASMYILVGSNLGSSIHFDIADNANMTNYTSGLRIGDDDKTNFGSAIAPAGYYYRWRTGNGTSTTGYANYFELRA